MPGPYKSRAEWQAAQEAAQVDLSRLRLQLKLKQAEVAALEVELAEALFLRDHCHACATELECLECKAEAARTAAPA